MLRLVKLLFFSLSYYYTPELLVQMYCISRLIVFLVSNLVSLHGVVNVVSVQASPRYYTIDSM